MRKLPRQNFVSLFRGGTAYRTSFPCDLAKFSVAGGDRVLGFCFVPDHRNIYRF